MKKTPANVAAAMGLAAFLCAALGGSLPGQTLEDVLARNYRTRGGLEKLKSLASWKMTGKIAIPAQGLEMPIAIWQKTPGKMRVETGFQSRTIVQAFDGRRAWWIVPFLSLEAQEMPAAQGRLFREQADFENPLLAYGEKGYTLELLGGEVLDGTPVFKLKLARPGGSEVHIFLDGESGIELKASRTEKAGENETRIEVLYGDYRTVDGLLVPFAVENRRNGKIWAKMTFDAIEINPVIDDAFFAMSKQSGVAKNEKPKTNK